jgi:hypothetical protein
MNRNRLHRLCTRLGRFFASAAFYAAPRPAEYHIHEREAREAARSQPKEAPETLPSGHPERLIPDVPLTASDAELWAQLGELSRPDDT